MDLNKLFAFYFNDKGYQVKFENNRSSVTLKNGHHVTIYAEGDKVYFEQRIESKPYLWIRGKPQVSYVKTFVGEIHDPDLFGRISENLDRCALSPPSSFNWGENDSQ